MKKHPADELEPFLVHVWQVFAFSLSWKLLWFTRELPNSSENVRVHIKDLCFYHLVSLKLTLLDAAFAGRAPAFRDSSFIFTMRCMSTFIFAFSKSMEGCVGTTLGISWNWLELLSACTTQQGLITPRV